VLTVTEPGVMEWLVILLVLIVLVATVGVALWAGVRRRRSSGLPPEDQEPPPGYWWDGEKWNPPGSTA
jgi:hypothetical protein